MTGGACMPHHKTERRSSLFFVEVFEFLVVLLFPVILIVVELFVIIELIVELFVVEFVIVVIDIGLVDRLSARAPDRDMRILRRLAEYARHDTPPV